MKKEMLINVLQPEECRIAILEDGVLEELYVERTSQESYVGNIYKGRIVNIEPSIQAAFVDFGIGRNGFLHVSDVEPAYYRHLETRRSENGGRQGGRRGGRDRGRGPAPGRGRRSEPDVVEPWEEVEDRADALSEQILASSPEEIQVVDPDDTDEAPSSAAGEPRPAEVSSPLPAPPESALRFAATESAAGENTEAPPRQPTPREQAAPEEEKPRYMGSAEHRTEEPKSTDPTPPAVEHEDSEIFFPKTDPGEPASRAEGAREPAEPIDSFFEEAPRLTDVAEASARELEMEHDLEETAEERADEREEDEPEPRRHRRPPRDDRRGPPRDDRRGPRRDDRRGPRQGRHTFSRPGFARPKPLIQDIFRRGQEVLVQVIKEGIGTKGPTLSTYISIAGRYLVLMPGLNRIGVSRKIADDEQRRRLREILSELKPPKGLGFIIRTAGLDRTKKELQRDLAYLSRLWQVVVRRIRKIKSPAEIYQESDMITRTIRDTFTSEIDTIWVDEPAAFEHAQEFLTIVMPRYANRIQLYNESEPMFHKHGIEEEIVRIQQRHVPLPLGGSIVIDQTEALVAIDVNSGNFRADNNAEETAYQMNLLAAKEIARQLRLRDLGGVIVNDFIDMREEKHRRDVERALRDAVRRDRARTKILKISAFGIIEMTRQRIRPSLKRSVYQDCQHCVGTGQVKTCESMSIDVMRMVQLAAHRENLHRIQIRVHEDVANYLLNKKRKEITKLEDSGELQVSISGQPGVSPETLEFMCYDNNNNEVKFQAYEESRPRRR